MVCPRRRRKIKSPIALPPLPSLVVCSLHVTGVIDGTKGDRAGMANVGVVLLDEQSGPFEEPFWQRVFSPNHPVQRVSALRDVAGAQGKVRFPRALFVPPGA